MGPDDEVRHWSALIVALIAGIVFTVRGPGETIFEQAAREVGLMGAVLTPLSLLTEAFLIFIAMLVAYTVVLSLLAAGSGRIWGRARPS